MADWAREAAKGLTRQQRRILDFVTSFLASERRAPSLHEIRLHVGVAAVSTVHEHLDRIIEKGYLARDWNRARSISLAEPLGRARAAQVVPLIGCVAEGQPITISEPRDVAVPAVFEAGEGGFALTVADGSFASQDICAGDLLIIARDGRIGDDMLLLCRFGEAAVIGLGGDVKSRFGALRRVVGGSSGGDGVLGRVVGLLRQFGHP